jgi:glucose-6-phosphate 1-dehydrogenase
VPITARLSQLFYERLGEQVTNELVEWLNSVDLQYRTDLRELNEQNFLRYAAESRQRFAEQDRLWENRLADIDRRFVEFEAKMDKRFAELEAKIERRFAEQTRFLYVSLAAQVFLIVGLFLK